MRNYLVALRIQLVIAVCAAIVIGNIHPLEAVSAAHAQAETPASIVATQIRRQGYKCDKPLSAEQDRAASKPDAAVWVLRCDSNTYRVRLHPDMAAQVEPVE